MPMHLAEEFKDADGEEELSESRQEPEAGEQAVGGEGDGQQAGEGEPDRGRKIEAEPQEEDADGGKGIDGLAEMAQFDGNVSRSAKIFIPDMGARRRALPPMTEGERDGDDNGGIPPRGTLDANP